MILTGHELTAMSTGVAAIAIVGGYLGVRSANRNALKLAREEREARRSYELTELKRIAYVRCLDVMYELEIATLLKAINASSSPTGIAAPEFLERQTKAYSAALNSSGEIKLFGPQIVIALMNDLMVLASQPDPAQHVAPGPNQATPFNVAQARLIAAMVATLDGKPVTRKVLEDAVSVATTAVSQMPDVQGENDSVEERARTDEN